MLTFENSIKHVLMNAVVIFVFSMLCVGCGNSKPTPLINGIISRQSPAQVKRLLKLNPSKYQVVESSPHKHLLTISIKGYSHLGVSGELYLDFFEDQLMMTTFYPADTRAYKKYKKLLRQRLPVRQGKEIDTTIGGTRICVGEYRNNKEGIAWKDVNLDREYAEWAWVN